MSAAGSIARTLLYCHLQHDSPFCCRPIKLPSPGLADEDLRAHKFRIRSCNIHALRLMTNDTRHMKAIQHYHAMHVLSSSGKYAGCVAPSRASQLGDQPNATPESGPSAPNTNQQVWAVSDRAAHNRSCCSLIEDHQDTKASLHNSHRGCICRHTCMEDTKKGSLQALVPGLSVSWVRYEVMPCQKLGDLVHNGTLWKSIALHSIGRTLLRPASSQSASHGRRNCVGAVTLCMHGQLNLQAFIQQGGGMIAATCYKLLHTYRAAGCRLYFSSSMAGWSLLRLLVYGFICV